MELDQNQATEPEASKTEISPEASGKIAASAARSGDDGNQEFSVVGIGASAGGLAAFERLFTHLPAGSGMAFVVIQHLSPPQPSILPEIIQRYTDMPVFQVIDGIEVKPEHVYIIPPGVDLALRAGRLKVSVPKAERGHRLPIDFFFHSLALEQGRRAIAIVLSGTGSDGSQGVKYIKAEEGLTIAQDPNTAEFGDMPRNAIATNDIDFTLPPEKMGELILKYLRHATSASDKRGKTGLESLSGDLQRLYFLLRSKTGHDFSLYKQNTILRRLERRMKVCLVQDLKEYIDRLEASPEELKVLFQELLINVTHFFRDPEAFQALSERVLRPLIQSRCATHKPVRVWVAGCSSGEEAYSIAIALEEQILALKIDCKLQIFATDIDEDSIAAARKGFYSDSSIESVSAERLQRFFHQEEHGYQVKKNIRDLVVFSAQNVISDPPFSRIDLLCCRNLLIYLEHELQIQLLQQFHYSLNPEGILFLGNSESIGRTKDLFEAVDRKHKIFRRKQVATQYRARAGRRSKLHRTALPEAGAGWKRSSAGGLREWIEKVLLEYYTPACVIVDAKNNILFIHGRTGKYLEPAAGEISSNLVRMAREGLKTELASALHAAAAHMQTVRREGLQIKTNGEYQALNLIVRPVDRLPGIPELRPEFPELMMVIFEAVPGTVVRAAPQASNATTTDQHVAQLEQALKEKDEYLHAIIDELERTNQDLRSANEELQSYNEEMQSANEELETSREELQSINEELVTTNAELQNKNEELYRINNDIHNLLDSTEIATIFLDLDLQIRWFTPQAQQIYNFRAADIGRPVGHLVSNLHDDHLVEDIQQVLHNLVPKAIEVQAKDEAWYLVNIRPYRTHERVIDGVVITFIDISGQKKIDQLQRMVTILRDSNDAVTVQDFEGRILAWNRGAARMYGWSEAEALAMNSLDLIPESSRAATAGLYRRLAQGEAIHSFETQRVRRDGRVLDVWMTLTAMVDVDNQPVGVATTERDITERKLAGQSLSFENRALKALREWYTILLERPERASLAAACQILVEVAGYRMAWLGKLEKNKAKTITPAAWGGLEETEEGGAQTVRALAEHSWRAVESALRSGRPVAVRKIARDPQHAGWRAEARQHHYGAFLALPISDQNGPPGVLAIYASEPEAFVEPEIDNLMRLCVSIAQATG